MAIITLTTDLGLKDYYVSAVKGTILSQFPEVTIVDISHQIPTYNIQDAAYILKNAYTNFPAGSIHIIGVKAEHSKETPHVIVFANGHYFVGADNGVFSLLLDNPPEKIAEINTDDNVLHSFPTRDVFAKAACHIAKGGAIEDIAHAAFSLMERMPFRAASMEDMIRGSVVYIDSYGNVMTNINHSLFKQIGKDRKFIIEFARYEINRLSHSYSDVPEGEALAIFNSGNYLEIAMNSGKADSLLGLKLNDSITINFQ
jgi:S-adenosylmethionine hydrolase